ncbi:hypothetical protein [Aequorivita sinensis]|uniref:hypothetical protein n=1 Tax=Aequorivita sinensis TaxID=1382458 RepID=UPI0023014652|nr:hypothetical protein [Aequorivita sinensis]
MFLGNNYNKYRAKIYLPKVIRALLISLIDAAKLDNEEIFTKLVLFIRDKIYNARADGSISAFKELIILPSHIYPIIQQKYRINLIDLFAIRFRENITLSLSSLSVGHSINLEKEKVFSEINYWATVQLLKNIIDARDYKSFTTVFDEINQITSRFSLNDYKNDPERITVDEILFMHRSVYFIIHSWLVFSYANNKITLAELNSFDLENNVLNQLLFRDDIELFELFIELKSRAFHSYLEIDNWELIEHKPGKAYTALSSRDWLNFGFTILLLKRRRIVFIRFSKEIKPHESFNYLISDIQPILENVEGKLIESWKSYLYPKMDEKETINTFNSSKENITEVLLELKKKQQLQQYKTIIDQPISDKKVKEFQSNVLKMWNNNNIIPSILKEYNCVEYLPNDIKIKGFGYFNLYTKMKSMFTEKDNTFIYGASDVGANLARDIERQFYSTLKFHKDFIETKDLKSELDALIGQIGDKSSFVIFADWKGIDAINKEREVEYIQESKDKFIYAKYKGISILSKSLVFPNTLLLIDLEKSIKYSIYTDDNWYDKELLIEVKELTQELIDSELEKYEEKWKTNDGYEVNKEEAELLIKSSVLIKVLFKSEMKVIGTDNYYFFKF